ncbi:tellurite resistance TerB family protein [Zavarzinia sp.]|uniref:tellurite resistance TerB family protein n=1 Tax=Zavarzinia sp. TaxID=2027920 RepID=UPI003BB79DDE
MFDAKSLLDRVLGSDIGRNAKGRLDRMEGSTGFASGAAAGGLLGLLLGSRSGRHLVGDVAKVGGAAALGYFAWKAYRNWQDGKAPGPVAADPAGLPPPEFHAGTAGADGKPFALALLTAMVGAAKADGHVDPQEQNRLFSEVERLGLGAEEKAAVFDLLARPIAIDEIAREAATPEQAAELYLAARLAIDPDQAAERAFLDGLAARLRLEPGLAAHLDAQVTASA